jgi:hypothetical protein
MTKHIGGVHVVTIKKIYKGKIYRTHLLRRSYREDGKVKNETLANLSHLPAHTIEVIRKSLKGETLVSSEDKIKVIRSLHHGHVAAVLAAMKRLDFENLIASRPSRERNLVVAMICARILEADTKLATTRWWKSTTLPDMLGVSDADEDDLYAAMDWLIDRQPVIEKKLAKRHLKNDGLVLFDLTSSYFEGTTCPLAKLGYNRDGKKGKLQVNYGILTDANGLPIAVSIFDGNTGDPKTLLPQVEKLRVNFGIERIVLVGDRGMISQKHVNHLRKIDGLNWIAALKTGAIRMLVEDGHIQQGLFDERNLFEISHPDFPGERLVACRNPELGKLREHKRQSLLGATIRELEKVRGIVSRGRLKGKDAIGVRVGRVVNKYKVAKHIRLEIDANAFQFSINEESVAEEAALDGIYVVRTSLPKERMSADDAVRNYKKLSRVERAFRSMKTIDLKVRPIHHRIEDRVRAHVFICMLAYYVELHMIEAWRSLLFCDEDQEAKKTCDPVAPARRSEKALKKVHSKKLEDGSPAHGLHTLLNELSTIVRNICSTPGTGEDAPVFEVLTEKNDKQQAAYQLIEEIRPMAA